MYGPRSAYDPMDVARWDAELKERMFGEALIRALQHPTVLAALSGGLRTLAGGPGPAGEKVKP